MELYWQIYTSLKHHPAHHTETFLHIRRMRCKEKELHLNRRLSHWSLVFLLHNIQSTRQRAWSEMEIKMWTGVTAITHSSLRRQCFNGIKGPTSTYSKTPGGSTRRLTLDTRAELGFETDGRALCFGDGTISRRCWLSSRRQPTLCVAVAQSHVWLQGSTRKGKHLASQC